MSSVVSSPHPAARDHFVHFYDEDRALAVEVARFLRSGLESGCGAIMIATAEHRDSVFAEWREGGFQPDAALARRQLHVLDARETLLRFMSRDGPDPELFERAIGPLVRDCIAQFGDLVAFGEMVSLLWTDGRPEAAVDLEDLWNGLAAQHRFALYCAYPMHACGVAEASESFRRICRAHSHVLPAKPVFGPANEDTQVRLLAELAQKAAALENELAMRKRVEGRLREREAEFADFFDNAPMALHRVGADGTILWANRAELQLLGYTPGEYIGRHISDFYADKRHVATILESLGRGATLRDEPVKLVCKNGSIKHALVSSNAQMEGGRFVATRCFTRDVTDRWHAQEALRERAAVLHLALQSAKMGYWVVGLDLNSIRFSHELMDLLGLTGHNEWPLESFVGLVHPEDRAAFRTALSDAIATRGTLHVEFRIHREDGSRCWLEARGEAVYDDSGRATRFYGICADITARRQVKAASL